MELTPVEDVSLQSGTAMALGQPQPEAVPETQPGEVVTNEDGTVTPAPAAQMNMCPHNAEFCANPDWESIVNAQRGEMAQRAAEAAAAAAAAEQQPQQPPAE